MLCTLLASGEGVSMLGAAQCLERLLLQHRTVGEGKPPRRDSSGSSGGGGRGSNFPETLIEASDGIVCGVLVSTLKSPPKPAGSTDSDTGMFSCACELLT